jgi:hypothetical protein
MASLLSGAFFGHLETWWIGSVDNDWFSEGVLLTMIAILLTIALGALWSLIRSAARGDGAVRS